MFFNDKLIELSSYYGVDPIIFGILYAGTIPLLSFSIYWIIRNVRRRESITIPVIITFFCMTGTYIYLLLVAQNIPVWLYGLAVCMVGFSGYNIRRKVKKKTESLSG
jgi:hypothetical protein